MVIQVDQVVGKMSVARELFSKARNVLKISQIFLFLWVFLRISANITIKRVQIWSEIGFCDAKYRN